MRYVFLFGAKVNRAMRPRTALVNLALLEVGDSQTCHDNRMQLDELWVQVGESMCKGDLCRLCRASAKSMR